MSYSASALNNILSDDIKNCKSCTHLKVKMKYRLGQLFVFISYIHVCVHIY